jgi:hypothetical protein
MARAVRSLLRVKARLWRGGDRCALALLLVGWACWPSVACAQSFRSQRLNQLKTLQLAVQEHDRIFRRLPTDLLDGKGKPLLSWRVQLLPFLERNGLFKKFGLDEPWDGTHNRELLAQVPREYFNPRGDDDPTRTTVSAPRGQGTAFGLGGRRTLAQLKGRLSTTVLFVEVDQSHAVPWTKPADLVFDSADPHRGLGKDWGRGFFHERGCWAVFADGTIRFLPVSMDDDLLRALFAGTWEDTTPRERSWHEALFRAPTAYLLIPFVLLSLLAVAGAAAVALRLARGRPTSPGEMLLLILGAQQLVHLVMFMSFYSYPLPPFPFHQERPQYSLQLWFLPRLAGAWVSLFAFCYYRADPVWRRLFALNLCLFGIYAFDAIQPHEDRYAEESFVTFGCPLVLGVMAIVAALLPPSAGTGRRWAHLLGCTVALLPLVWFGLWLSLGYVAPREVFLRIHIRE